MSDLSDAEYSETHWKQRLDAASEALAEAGPDDDLDLLRLAKDYAAERYMECVARVGMAEMDTEAGLVCGAVVDYQGRQRTLHGRYLILRRGDWLTLWSPVTGTDLTGVSRSSVTVVTGEAEAAAFRAIADN